MANRIISGDGLKIYLHQENAPGTITDSFDRPRNYGTDLAFDGTNLISADYIYNNESKIYIHSGITSTISTSFVSTYWPVYGLTYDIKKNRLISCSETTGYIHSGVTSTIISTFTLTDNKVKGLAFDGDNLISVQYGSRKIRYHVDVGELIYDSFFTTEAAQGGLAFDGNNVYTNEGVSPYYVRKYDYSTKSLLASYNVGLRAGLTWEYGSDVTAKVITKSVSTNYDTTTITAFGLISSIGSANCTVRGFKYGLTETDTWSISEGGSFGVGQYALTITGLDPDTTYYIRAFVANEYGIFYGDYISFKPKMVGFSYGLYEESNSPTICFYLSEDDGRTWGLKHGPYTTDQADIEITKLLVQGSGKKKIKFTTDALTGISASVMCKLDIKTR